MNRRRTLWLLRVRLRMSWMSDPAEEQISHSDEVHGFGDVEALLGCVLLRGRRRRSSHFECSGQNLTRGVAAGASAAERASLASTARMRVQVQVRLAPLPETPLYKAI